MVDDSMLEPSIQEKRGFITEINYEIYCHHMKPIKDNRYQIGTVTIRL